MSDLACVLDLWVKWMKDVDITSIRAGTVAVCYIRYAVALLSVDRRIRNVVSSWPMALRTRPLLHACLPDIRTVAFSTRRMA